MTANTPQTRKAKGRNAVKEVKDMLLRLSDLPDGDILIMPTSVPGEDLKLSPKAEEIFPFSFEVKCQEKLQFWEAIRQTEWNAEKNGKKPALIFRRNHEKFRVVIDFDLFLELVLKSRNATLP